MNGSSITAWLHNATSITEHHQQKAAEVMAMPTAAVKKLARYCCVECGAKELFLYCWKGCRHIQNIKAFYSETKTICQELETLKETIYAQEIRLRNADVLLKEKQQSLDVLMDEVNRLPQLRVPRLDKCAPVKPTTAKESISIGLPCWSGIAVRLILDTFDVDKDGRLDKDELDSLVKALQKTDATFDGTALVTTTDKQGADAASILAYYGNVSIAQLTSDLETLGIQFGNTPMLATSVVQTIDVLHGFVDQAKEFQQEVTTLKSEVNEKARATTRLREGFAEVKTALDDKDTEIQRVCQDRSHVDKMLQTTKDQMASMSTELQKITGELSTRNNAIHDLRALVEDQVHEKEKWQRYCWELEERLYDAVHTSHAKEHDLWKTRDAKKEEARKNMLLYMDRGMGKKHFGDKAGVAKDPSEDLRLASFVSKADAETDSVCCSGADTVFEITPPFEHTPI